MRVIFIKEPEERKENNRFAISLFIAFIITALFGFAKFSAWALGFEPALFSFGIMPHELIGLRGIFLSPLIHADAGHYFGNAVPMFILSGLIIYFYRSFYFRILLLVWVFDGAGVWLIGRQVYHIGASGLVYGLAAFAFFSGVLKKNRNLLALSLLVLFLYGSMIWGMYPLDNGVSWEAHLAGFLTGTFMAVFYRNRGPENDAEPEWMNEPDENEEPQPADEYRDEEKN